MIKVDEILKKHCHITSDGQEDLHTSVTSVKDAIKEITVRILAEAAHGSYTTEQREEIRNTIKKVEF